MSQSQIYSVSEITRSIKLLIEENLPTIWIHGEVSNFKNHYSGHFYFTLKDENAQISAVMWKTRAQSIPFELNDGMQVQALGNIRLYEKSGRYQIDIIRMQPAGIGKLQQAFEELKLKLNTEGLFDQEHKKVLPGFPEQIGIITSETGAAIRDMINVLQRRAPNVQIIVRPAKVQGNGAADDIAGAIEEFNDFGKVDVLIVGRGGGSLEDLWAFNEEVVARAIYNSTIPVISAVGHEIDFTISDFVADLRAPTPSAAAELACPDYREVNSYVRESYSRIKRQVLTIIERNRERIDAIRKSYGFRKPEDLIHQHMLYIDELASRLQKIFIQSIKQKTDLLSNLSHRLDNLNPKQVLERGYSISYRNGEIVRDLSAVQVEDDLETEFSSGKIKSKIYQINRRG